MLSCHHTIRSAQPHTQPSALGAAVPPIATHPEPCGQTTSLTLDQFAALRRRAEQLGVTGRASRMPPTEILPVPGAFNAQSVTMRPMTMPATQLDPQGVSARHHSAAAHVSQHYTTSGHLAQIVPTQTNTPVANATVHTEMLARTISTMNAIQRSMEERLEESIKQSSTVSERLDRLDKDVAANREHSRQDSARIVAYLDNMARMTSQRLKIVGDHLQRVEGALRPSYAGSSSAPSGNGQGDAEADGPGKSVEERMDTVERLLMELLEKVNDRDAKNAHTIRHDASVNTDAVERVDADIHSLAPPKLHGKGVGHSAEFVHSGTYAKEPLDDGDSISFTASSDISPVWDDGAHRVASGSHLLDSNSTHCSTFSTAPRVLSSSEVSLWPASWRDEPMSDLSSRSTSPGETVSDLRSLLCGGLQRSASARSSPDAPLARVLLQCNESPPPKDVSTNTSPTATRAGEVTHHESTTVASSRAVSLMLPESRSGSPPIEYVALPDGPESESETHGGEKMPGSAGNPIELLSPFTAASIPLRRRRSCSLDSLSSLSSLSSSTSSEAAASTSRHVKTSISRPRKRKRKAPLSSDALATKSRTAQNAARSKKSQPAVSPVQRKAWEVTHGYDGPCEWPKVIDDDKTCSNLIQCDKCECWYHWGCVGIAEQDPHAKEEDIPFTCPACEASIQKHGIARNVRGIDMDRCARPKCSLKLAFEECYLEYLIGRKLDITQVKPLQFVWLVKWANYPATEATWEPDDAFPHGRERYIAEFEEAAIREGLRIDNPSKPVLLREAKAGRH
ncbi:hypothetical protein BC835DRAFT_312537 [Cytidiella melzeri]|nr:hypothetical protein BC835DRAFT_312537 [Cytidiella melzeri]